MRVPASSANLGPGYDVLAAALDLWLELEVSEMGEFSVDTDGLDVPADRTNLVVRAFETLHPADGLRFEIRSEIPLNGGLGSSAAAIVAGLIAADHLYELGLEHDEVLERAAAIEGHPDNVAAALGGGFVICTHDGERVRSDRFEAPQGLEAVLVVPDRRVATEEARLAVPDSVPLPDATANIGATALLVQGLATADWDRISRGLRDRVHQPARAHLYPESMEVVKQATEAGALGASISGSGPAVLVWTLWEQTGGVVSALRDRMGEGAEVRRVRFTPLGADVPEL